MLRAILCMGVFAASISSAEAFGGRRAVSYCPPAVTVYLPVCGSMPVAYPGTGTVVPAVPKYAIPKPAPASKTTEPPPIRDSSFYSRGDSKTCKVGFWNLSGQDVLVKINGQSQLVPRDRALTIDLGHDFTWQVDGRTSQDVHVPADKTAHDIVLRR